MSGPKGGKRLAPGDTIGILGGGQLGRMLALAAAPLGLKAHIYCPDRASPAFDVSAARTVAAYDDEAALAEFADAVDAITYEFENVPAPTAAFLARHRPVRPGPDVLDIAQDRLAEKAYLAEAGLPVAEHVAIDGLDDLETAVASLGAPAILKTRRLGYDGKGQAVIRSAGDCAGAWEAVGGAPSILEGLVAFDCEISVIAARGIDGATATYDPARNTHRDGILDTSVVPARAGTEVERRARALATTLLERLDYVGVLGIEFFVAGDRLIANEIAPRVHNSGHWTIEACQVSQFEQHMRAVAGWPLGSAERHHDAVMTNLIGADAESWQDILARPAASLHLYGKTEIRAGRKMGHTTALAPKTGG